MTPTPTHKALTPAGEWVEGWFDYSYGDHPVIWLKQPNEEEEGSFVEALPETVCRATGRPDSNGKMMYEGDYVQIEGDPDIYEIEYNQEYCAFILIGGRLAKDIRNSTYTIPLHHQITIKK